MDDIYDCMLISLPLIISSIMFSAFIYYCPKTILDDIDYIPPIPSKTIPTIPSKTIPTIPSKTISSKTIPTIPSKTISSKTIPQIPSKTISSKTISSKTIPQIPSKTPISKKIIITLPNIKEENNLVIIYKLPLNNNICVKKCLCVKKLLSEYKELNFEFDDECEFVVLDDDEIDDDEINDDEINDDEINDDEIDNIQLKTMIKKIEYLTNNIKCNMDSDNNLTDDKKQKLNSIINKIKKFTKNADDTKILAIDKYKEKIELLELLKNFKLD
jgi:hypothetical protein